MPRAFTEGDAFRRRLRKAAIPRYRQVAIEQNSISQARKAIFSKESYQGLLKSDVRNQLHLIAEEQAALLAA